MKKILFLLFVTQISFSQNKQETIDWLNTKLAEYTNGSDVGAMGEYRIAIGNVEGYGETVQITKRVYFMEQNQYTYYSFKPEAITAINLTRKYRSDRINGKLDIEFVSKNSRIYKDAKEFVMDIPIYCYGPNEEITKIHKGLLHLFALMGNTITEKDYFKN